VAGAAWEEIDGTVRRAHAAEQEPIPRPGRFCVRRGTGLAARLLSRLLRLPASGEDVALELTIIPAGTGETWRRRFDGVPFETAQWLAPDGALAERVGFVRLPFRLAAEAGALVYRHCGTALLVGPLALPLPAAISPRVGAEERPGPEGMVRGRVAVSLPLLGRLIEYEGLHAEAR
jgi:hypothetical protein